MLLIEEEANLFAAALLMPQRTVERTYRPTEGQPNRFERLCEIFSASVAAISRRLPQVMCGAAARRRTAQRARWQPAEP